MFVDLLVLGLAAGSAYIGWRRGVAVSLIASVAFLVTGIPGAAIVAAAGSPVPNIIGLVMGGMLGLVFVALRAEAIEAWVADSFSDGARAVDRVLGAGVNVFVALAMAWFVAAVASVVPGSGGPMGAVRSSATLGVLVDELPPAGPLGALILRSGLVPGLNGPLVLAETPDPTVIDVPAVRLAANSVLQVRGPACGELVTGTAWVVAPGLLLTNAHVVAGQTRTVVSGGPGARDIEVDVTAVDRQHDLAVLASRSPGLPAVLPMVTGIPHGTSVVAIGYPLGGPLHLSAARFDRIAPFSTVPVGGGPAADTDILVARGQVQPGNSGGPIVDTQGRVIGMVAARGVGQRVASIYGIAAKDLGTIVAQGAARQRVSPGGCLTQSQLRDRL